MPGKDLRRATYMPVMRRTTTCLKLTAIPFFVLLAVGSSSPKKDGAAENDKTGVTGTTAGLVGSAVAVGDAEWTILDLVNRGSQMKANESFEKDATTSGTFVQVHFKVANKGKKEGTIGELPKLIDGNSREFGTIDNASSFRPKGTSGVFLDKINPTLSKEFTEIYELPAGVSTVSIKTHDFGLFGKEKLINLGALPAAPPPAPVVAAPAAKAAGSAAKPVGAAAAGAGGPSKAKAGPAKK